MIYYEWEGGKLDRFLEDADKLADERNRIYRHYCSLALTTPLCAPKYFQTVSVIPRWA